jgi:putative membrane protein
MILASWRKGREKRLVFGEKIYIGTETKPLIMSSNAPLQPDPESPLAEKDKKALKKEKREFKDQLAIDRTALAIDRTLLAMVRTGTTFMTFGFAIYKLMKETARQPGDHPLMDIFTPKGVALILFISGWVGLLMAVINAVSFRRKISLDTASYYWSPTMLLSYVILAVLTLLITALLIGNA